MSHFLETLFGTAHQSFVIGKTVTQYGVQFGPTIYQGVEPPNPTTDSISTVLNNGDIWIQTGPTPTINQYIGNTWVSLVADPSDLPIATLNDVNIIVANGIIFTINTISNTIANTISNTITTLENTLANTLVQLSDTIILSQVDSIVANAINNSVIANAVTLDDVNTIIANAISLDIANVATLDDINVIVGNAVANVAYLEDVTTIVSNAVANTATLNDINVIVGNAISLIDIANVAYLSDVANAVANVAYLSDVANAIISINDSISNTLVQLSNTILNQVDAIVANVTTATLTDVNTIVGNAILLIDGSISTLSDNVVFNVSSSYGGVPTGSVLAPFGSIQAAIAAANSSMTVIAVAPGTYVGDLTVVNSNIQIIGQSPVSTSILGNVQVDYTSVLWMENFTINGICDVANSSILNLDNITLNSNNSGITLDNTSTVQVTYSTFSVENGYIVSGSDGSSFIYGNILFTNGSSNLVAISIGNIVELVTSFTLG